MPELNPRFRQQIPDILERLAQTQLATERHLEQAQVAVGEMHDFVGFEIEKTTLAIERLEWEPRLSPEQAAELEELVAYKEELTHLASLHPEAVMQSYTFIQSVRQALIGLESAEKMRAAA